MAAAPMTRKLRVTNFRRVSTDRQDTERQQFDLDDNVEQFDLDVVETVELKISGPKVNQNAKWQAMLDGIKSPERDAMNLSALDRLFRPEDFNIIGQALQVFIDYKKIIITTKEGLIKPWEPRGWAICMEAVTQAGKELAELKRRTAGGRRKAHAANKPMNTTPPYGILYRDRYSKDAAGKCQYFYEDPEPASNGQPRREIVEMIFNWRYVERMRVHRIVKRLNGLGILSCGKKKKDGSWQYEPGLWSRDVVLQLLKNRHYIGEHWEGGKKVDVACPQFIDREIFEAVQSMFLRESAKSDKKGRPSKESLLGTFLKCGRCQHPLYFRPLPNGHHFYNCLYRDHRTYERLCSLGQIQARMIEPVVFAAIWEHITQPEVLIANARAYYDSLPTRPAAAALEKEQAAVMARIARMQRMVHKGTYDEDKGNDEILADQKRIAEIQAELKTAGVRDLPAKHLVEAACRRIAEGRMPSQFDTQRPVLDKLLDLAIYYDGECAVIEGRVPIPAAAAPARNSQKCYDREHGPHTSAIYIPFKIKATVPPNPPRVTRATTLKGWETRRKNGNVGNGSPEVRSAASRKGWQTMRKNGTIPKQAPEARRAAALRGVAKGQETRRKKRVA